MIGGPVGAGEGSGHMAVRRLRLAVLIGAGERRFARSAGEWFAALARRRDDLEVDVVDLAQAWLPEAPLLPTGPPPLAVCELSTWLSGADAFVVVTPELNHSFPGSLKNAIDWFGAEWRTKPVAFVAYGGAGSGRHAVDQLRPVFTEVDAVAIRDAVCLDGPAATAEDPASGLSAHERQAGLVLSRLVWWAEALSAHRGHAPYPGPDRPSPADTRPAGRTP
ncbi:NADPH-dependent FMN reductase [Nocardiopsis mangrovi]|uniref:NADPH-dependent FMN reductase n=1 Tax=Nocardiopsis mangrovi TaxID=1179818 RepID=A0ABV9DQS3_9ACTN